MKTSNVLDITNMMNGKSVSSMNKNSSKAGEFDLLMSHNLSGKKQSVDQILDSKVEKSQKAGTKKSSFQDGYSKKTGIKKVSTSETKRSNENSKTTDTEITQTTNDDKAVVNSTDTKSVKKNDPIKEAEIAAMLQDIREVVSQALDLTDEEFDQLLQDNGINLSDLTDSDVLKELILTVSDKSNVLDFLTDSRLTETYNQIMNGIESILDDSSIDFSEDDFKSIVDQALMQDPDVQEDLLVSPENEDKLNSLTQSKDINLSGKTDETNGENKQNTQATIEVMKVETVESQTTQTGAQSHSDDNVESQMSEQFASFMENLNNVNSQTRVEYVGDTARVIDVEEIANQILEKIRVVIKPEQTSMELQLNPENLGKVNLTVQSKDGLMTAQFVVQNETSKEVIESQLHILREALNQQGVKVEAIEVTVASYNFDNNTQMDQGNESSEQNQNKSQRITMEDALAMNEEQVVEEQLADGLGVTGTNIDMTA